MSSYTLQGDIALDGFWSGVKKAVVHSPLGQTVKFIANPVKQTKAAIKTTARFDPTAKSAKYGNVTKGVLAGAALTGAAILTGGGALAVAGGIASAAGTGIGIASKPVRKPAKKISPDPLASVKALATGSGLKMPLNSFTGAPSSDRPADTAITSSYTSTSKPDPKKIVAIGVVAAVLITVAVIAMKESS